jgi:CBS domain-containing protein
VQEFVDETLLRTPQRCFMVTENGSIAGLVTLHEVRKLERERWPQTELREVMQPLEKVRSVTPETPALRALEMMARENVNQLPVISDHHLEGMLSRGSILQVLMARADLAGNRVTGSAQ